MHLFPIFINKSVTSYKTIKRTFPHTDMHLTSTYLHTSHSLEHICVYYLLASSLFPSLFSRVWNDWFANLLDMGCPLDVQL